MRKLKALLVVLFATCLSLTLFACGGGGGDENKISSILDPDPITLTDSDDENALNTKLSNFSLSVRDPNRVTSKVSGSDCEITNNTIEYGVVGDYTITLKPKNNNPDGLTKEVPVTVDHDWGTPDADGKEVCAHDKATRVTKDENVAIHYGTFHEGTENANETAIKGTALTADEAADLGLHAETSNGKVFNANAGINEGVTSSGRIAAFGEDGVYEGGGTMVPTLTAGNLEPGMSITIKGYAKTDVTSGDYDPWKHATEYYNAPSYGIADPYFAPVADDTSTGAASVIIRSEGWVLYNGIGSPRLIGGLPTTIEGGMYGTGTDISARSNYGSIDDEENKLGAGYDSTNRPAFTSSDWKNWWVYSEGTGLRSTVYGSYTAVKITWTYRTYKVSDTETVGIIIIDSEFDDGASNLRSYIKVPTSVRGYYKTIIHGDFSSLLITESSVVETETMTDMQIAGTQDNATTKYLAGQQITDIARVLKVQVKSEQNPSWHDYSITNDDLYYYKGEATDAAGVKAELTTEGKWEAVGHKPLTEGMKFFKVEFKRSDKLFSQLAVDGSNNSYITVIENNVGAAYADDYDPAKFVNRDPMAEYTLSLAEVTVGTEKKDGVQLDLNRAILRALPADQTVFTLTDADNYRYAVLRLVGLGSTSGWYTGDETKSGSSANYAWSAKKDTANEGKDVLVAVALKEAALGNPIVIDGVQGTPIQIVFGTSSLGFTVSSAVTGANFDLNKGGTATITYTGATVDQISYLRLYMGSKSSNISVPATFTDAITFTGTSVKVTGITKGEGTMTVTVEFGAFDFANWTTEMPHIQALSGTRVVADDYIDYKFTMDSSVATMDSGYYLYKSGDRLYFVTLPETATANSTLKVVVNAGEEDKIFDLDLSYEYDGTARTAAFVNKNLDASIYSIAANTYKTPAKTLGTIIVVSVDAKALTGFTGKYGFQVNPGKVPSDKYFWAVGTDDQNADALKKETIEELGELKMLVEGTCVETGKNAYEVTVDGIKFYAYYQTVGGNHVDTNDDNKCDLCGGTMSTGLVYGKNDKNEDTTWFPIGHASEEIHEGEQITFTGTYRDDIGESGFGSVLAVFIEEADGPDWDNDGNDEGTNGTWHTTQDGYATWTNFGWSTNRWPYADVEGYDHQEDGYSRFTNSVITDAHPSNTANGWVNGYGTTIDETNFNAAKQGGTFRFIVTRLNGVITTTAQLWSPAMIAYVDTPFFEYTTTVKVDPDAGRYTVKVMGKQQNNNQVRIVDNKVNVTVANLNNSVIKTVEGATVNNHDGSAGATWSYTGTTISPFGMAATESSTHFVAFKVTFSQALPGTTTVKIVGADGSEIADADTKLTTDNTVLEVYVPVTATMGSFKIDFTNKEGSTLQRDITVDLAQLAVSNVTATLSDTSSLTLAEGEFNIAYTGVQDSYTVSVNGGTAVALSALATAKASATDLGALKAYKSGNTVNFVKGAADITKAIPSYTIEVRNGNELVAITKVDPIVTIGTQFGKSIAGENETTLSGWYAIANGTTLTLFSNSDTNPATEAFRINVNAGHETDPDLLGWVSLGFEVKNGVVSFREDNDLTSAAKTVYTASGSSHLTVIILQLSGRGVAADTVYGFKAIGTNGDETTGEYWSVSAQREFTQHTLNGSGEKWLVREATCLQSGVQAYGEGTKDASTYYYNYTLTAKLEHTWEKKDNATEAELHGYDEMYTCTNECDCGMVKYTQSGVTQTWDAQDKLWGVDGSNWTHFGSIKKGDVYEITGKNYADGEDIFELNAVGISKTDTGNGKDPDRAVRDDGWNFNLATGSDYGAWSTVYTKMTNADGLKGHLDDVDITYVIDYTQEDKIIISVTIGDQGTITSTLPLVTIADEYQLYFHPDGSKYEAKTTAYITSEDAEPTAPLDKHVHGNWNEQDRCPDDGFLNPAHEHSYTLAGDKEASGNVYCRCGELNPNHTHEYTAYYVCKYCGNADLETIKALSVTDQNVGTGGFGGTGGWWGCASDNLTTGAGDFLVKFTFSQGTSVEIAGCPEVIYTEAGEHGDGYLSYNPNDTNYWGGIMGTGNNPGTSASPATVTSNIFGTKPAVAATVTYEVYVWRLGSTMVVSYNILNSNEVVWQQVLVVSNIETQAVNIHINGHTSGYTDLHGYLGTITEKDVD